MWNNNWIFYLFPFIYVYLNYVATWKGYWLLAVPVYTFVVIPILDVLGGVDTLNPDRLRQPDLWSDNRFRIITWAWVPAQIVCLMASLIWVCGENITMGEFVGMTVGIGLTNGAVGIVVAHELMHKNSKFEQFLSQVLLMTVSYPHFFIEHIYGHHRNVATPIDPASAKSGDTFYTFYLKVIPGSFMSAWNIEKKKLQEKNMNVYSFSNKMIVYIMTELLLYSVIYIYFALPGLVFYVCQGIVAFTTLEIINYIEHYGLYRDEVKPGEYEKVQPYHSWNSGAIVTNHILLNLARHSDHHVNAKKLYQTLRHEESAPQLPLGYASMFLLALVPPIWFKVMDPKIKKWKAQYKGI